MDWITRINWVDVVLILIVVRSGYVGFQRGVFGELFHLAGFLLSIIVSMHVYGYVVKFFNTYLFLPLNISIFFGFVITAIFIFLVFIVISRFASRVIKVEIFPLIDRVGGPLIGACKGFVLSAIVASVLFVTPIEYVTVSAAQRSVLAPHFVGFGIGVYKATIGRMLRKKDVNISRILEGADPIDFHFFKSRRKDKLEEILE